MPGFQRHARFRFVISIGWRAKPAGKISVTEDFGSRARPFGSKRSTTEGHGNFDHARERAITAAYKTPRAGADYGGAAQGAWRIDSRRARECRRRGRSGDEHFRQSAPV